MSALLDRKLATEGLYETKPFCPKQPKNARETSSQNENKIFERARTLCHQGLIGKAAEVLSSDKLAPSNEKTYEDLCALHPKEKEPILLVTDELCLGCPFSERVVSDMLSSFPKGTAAGPGMMYPDRLSNAILCNNLEQSRIAMQKATSLINFSSASGFPNDIGPTFCNSSLTAMKKEKTGVQPPALGKVFRRLLAKCLVCFAKQEALEIFCPNQSCHKGKRGIYYPRKKN